MHKGRVVFGTMDEVVFGRPAAEAVVEQTDRLRASRAFLWSQARSTGRPTRSNRFARRSDRAMPASSMRCRRTRRAKP